MNYSHIFESMSLPTVTDLHLKQYCGVSIDSTGNAIVATAAKAVVGILQNTPDGVNDTAASIAVRGITRVAITDTIVIGAPLAVASGGSLVNAGAGTAIAVALEPGVTGNTISAVLLTSAAPLV